jgi:branched-chain amino acid transport system permease protein
MSACISLSIATVYVIVPPWIGDDIGPGEETAEALGVNTEICLCFDHSFMAGLAGGIYAYYSSAAQPGYLFESVWTFDAVIIVFVGGVGTMIGPIVGSVFFVLLQRLLSLYLPGGIHVAVFGALFIIVVSFLPGGLIELMTKLRKKIQRSGQVDSEIKGLSKTFGVCSPQRPGFFSERREIVGLIVPMAQARRPY